MTSIILLQMHIPRQMLIIDGEEANHKVLKSSPKKWRSLTLLGPGQQRRLTQTAKVRRLKSSFNKNPSGLLFQLAIKKSGPKTPLYGTLPSVWNLSAVSRTSSVSYPPKGKTMNLPSGSYPSLSAS